jgi:cytidyltransferase-like protein
MVEIAPIKVMIVSGYYSPCHAGHIEYVKLAKDYVGKDGVVYVIVNNDNQAILKKGYSFIPENDRLAIMDSLKYVDKAFLSIDTDRTVCKTIEWIYNNAKHKATHFGNGGDVTPDNPSPEDNVCKKNGIEMVYGLGDKIQSSSWILEKSVKDAYKIMFI